jgi:hypothetical protein
VDHPAEGMADHPAELDGMADHLVGPRVELDGMEGMEAILMEGMAWA